MNIPSDLLLQRCESSSARLAKLLTKDQLKAECAKRKLLISGTKGDLAPRLLSALQEEDVPTASSSAALPPPPSPVAPAPSAPPPLPREAPRRRAAPSGGAAAAAAATATTTAAAPDGNSNSAATGGGFGAGAAAYNPHARYDASGALIDIAPAEGTLKEQPSSGADLELTILGSGACNPSPWRGASCAALRVRDSYWLFDVGEGTQVQLQRSSVRPSKIDKIFITHAHGDHCFGLPGLLCMIARGRDPDAPPVEIYGPQGLRAFARISLAFTGTRMLPPYVVHEIHGIPLLRRGRGDANKARPLATKPAEKEVAGPGSWGEVRGGSDLLPNEDGSWWPLIVPSPPQEEGKKAAGGRGDGGRGGRGGVSNSNNGRDDDDVTTALSVHAAPVHHTVPCVGYIISEQGKPGRLLVEKVLPRLEANRDGIKEEYGLRDPRALMKKVKLLGPTDTLPLPDGTELKGSEVIGAARRGRKLVVLGDCCDASLCVELGQGADLVVHEATNAFLPRFGDPGTDESVERETARHGHSTPQMAGRLARRMGARALVLTHFSQRYHPSNLPIMRAIARLASRESGLPADCVASAHDGLVLPLWQPDREKPPLPPDALTAPDR